MIAAHLAKYQTRDKVWRKAIAIVRDPGSSDVLYLINEDEEIVPYEKVFQYKLYPHYGSISLATEI